MPDSLSIWKHGLDAIMLCARSTVQYLQFVAAQLPNATAASDSLRPTELRAPAGCVAEPSADYMGAAPCSGCC